MIKSVVREPDVAPAAVREVRPVLFLEPARLPLRSESVDAAGQAWLEDAAMDSVPALVRSLVDHTIALQNRRAIERGNPQPIQVSVLNRRRRAARSWILAVLGGKVDAATRHAVASQWLPTLCGTGPDLHKVETPARSLLEFLRGAITACIFDEPAANLLAHAKALAVLEAVLSVHLAAVQLASRATAR
jgi:hypothetical protein